MVVLNELSRANPPEGSCACLGCCLLQESQLFAGGPLLTGGAKGESNDKESVQLLGLSYYFSGKNRRHSAARASHLVQAANVDALYVLGLCYNGCPELRRRTRGV